MKVQTEMVKSQPEAAFKLCKLFLNPPSIIFDLKIFKGVFPIDVAMATSLVKKNPSGLGDVLMQLLSDGAQVS